MSLLFCSYFQYMKRLLTDDYVPDEQDVLRSRVQTTGIIETSFHVKQLTYRSPSLPPSFPPSVPPIHHNFIIFTGWLMLGVRGQRDESGFNVSMTCERSCLSVLSVATT